MREILDTNPKLNPSPPEYTRLPFDSDEDTREWIYADKLVHSNMINNQRTLYIGRLYNLRKQKKGRYKVSPEANSQNVHLKGEHKTTAETLAEQFRVSERTVRRAAEVAEAFEEADEETCQQFLSGQISKRTLLEKTTKEKVTTLDDPEEFFYPDGSDANTGYMKTLGPPLSALIKEFKDQFHDILTRIERPEHNFPSQAKITLDLMEKFISEALLHTARLKFQFVCDLCLGSGCWECKEGYVGHSTWQCQKSGVNGNPALGGRKWLLLEQKKDVDDIPF